MEIFVPALAILGCAMLVWACIEVGSNDGANLVNAVFGARILSRQQAVALAGIFVVLGAGFAGGVLDTVRSGIFDVPSLSVADGMVVFLASYLVNTLLLFSFSAYGLPVSTTATLMLTIAGAAIGVSGRTGIINGATMTPLMIALFVSIPVSGLAGFTVQRVSRTILGHDLRRRSPRAKRHSPWLAGFLVTAMTWFIVECGLALAVPDSFRGWWQIALWGFLTLAFRVVVRVASPAKLLEGTAVLGMVAMAFAFGQNDLANCAAPGLGILHLWLQYQEVTSPWETIPLPLLWGCGFLLVVGMGTRRAQRVTRAEVNTGSRQQKVKIYAPQWTQALARKLLPASAPAEAAPPLRGRRTESGKKIHYDPLRAAVILGVSACVIAFASRLGLPVSTTYVSFAAVIATGWGDKVFQGGGQADLKLGRAIWVVTAWILAGTVALGAGAVLARFLAWGGWPALVVAFGAHLALRWALGQRADRHEKTYHRRRRSGKKAASEVQALDPGDDSSAQPE